MFMSGNIPCITNIYILQNEKIIYITYENEKIIYNLLRLLFIASKLLNVVLVIEMTYLM